MEIVLEKADLPVNTRTEYTPFSPSKGRGRAGNGISGGDARGARRLRVGCRCEATSLEATKLIQTAGIHVVDQCHPTQMHKRIKLNHEPLAQNPGG